MKRFPKILLFSIAFTLCISTSLSYAALTTLDISRDRAEIFADAEPKTGLEKFFKIRDDIAEKYGSYIAFLTHYQQTVALDSSINNGNSRSLWYYSLALDQQIWSGGHIDAEMRGDVGSGMDELLPTFSMFNGSAPAFSTLYVPRLFLGQHFLNDRIYLAAGKIDISDWFDASEPADSADEEFASYALVHNLTIPFPNYGVGCMGKVMPFDWVYLQSGMSDASATGVDGRISGAFKTPFFINEIGFMPELSGLEGHYRFIFWANFQKRDCLDGDGTKPTSAGFGVSFDQKITEKVTTFFRYGLTDKKVWEIENFWSTGFEITDPLPRRKYDVFGLGVAQSITGTDFRKNNDYKTSSTETMLEAYYVIEIHRLLAVTPNIQFVITPDADPKSRCDIVAGVRLISSF